MNERKAEFADNQAAWEDAVLLRCSRFKVSHFLGRARYSTQELPIATEGRLATFNAAVTLSMIAHPISGRLGMIYAIDADNHDVCLERARFGHYRKLLEEVEK